MSKFQLRKVTIYTVNLELQIFMLKFPPARDESGNGGQVIGNCYLFYWINQYLLPTAQRPVPSNYNCRSAAMTDCTPQLLILSLISRTFLLIFSCRVVYRSFTLSPVWEIIFWVIFRSGK